MATILVSKQKVSWYVNFEIYKNGLFLKHLLIYFIFHFKISKITESITEIEKHEMQPKNRVVVQSCQNDSSFKEIEVGTAKDQSGIDFFEKVNTE